MNVKPIDLRERIATAFAVELASTPPMSLRAAGEVDVGRPPPPFDPAQDAPSNEYLEQHAYDLPFLDSESWRFYLPRLLALAVADARASSNAVDGLLESLRPPDREPPRLASLSSEQEAIVASVLKYVAFGEGAAHCEAASTALEEWWGEAPLYRPRRYVALYLPSEPSER